MAMLKPFAALRPVPAHARAICELPYDVLSSEEARQVASGNPLSFLRVSKPEIEFASGQEPSSPEVYGRARANFQRLIEEGSLRQDGAPAFYLYRQVMKDHEQTGLVGVVSCREYLEGRIKPHELTRPDKEEDRVRHIETLNAQTGPVFLIHPSSAGLEGLAEMVCSGPPEIDFVAPDGVRHSAWTVSSSEDLDFVAREFEAIPRLYIADGHHRSAAAVRVGQARQGGGSSDWFLAVLFPEEQVQILPYHRVLTDLHGHSPSEVLRLLKGIGPVEQTGRAVPAEPHEVGLYLEGQWHSLNLRAQFAEAEGPVSCLDVSLLQRHVLEPVFGIADPRTSRRIDFVGGIRGTEALEKLVNRGRHACAFSLAPTRVEELLAVADAGQIMPPKSTWFEPKLRDGMFCHLI